MKPLEKILLVGILIGGLLSGAGYLINSQPNKIGNIIGYAGVGIYAVSSVCGVIYTRIKK